jgi:hypothetical protein
MKKTSNGNNDRKSANQKPSKLLLKSETMRLLVQANLSWVAGGVDSGDSTVYDPSTGGACEILTRTV